MKVGDLVRPKRRWIETVGIVLETGVYTGNKEVKVMWEDGKISMSTIDYLEVISESR